MRSQEQAILRFLDEIEPLRMHGFILRLHGQVLAEGYWQPFSADVPHRMYSVSKTCVSMAIGILVRDGLLSIDQRIVSFFPEYTDDATDPLLREVTIRDMLRMATCYDRAMYAPLDDADWTRPFFYGKASHVPGTVFSYDTSASQVMASLVRKLTGQDVLAFLEARLFSRLGMNGPKRWLKDAAGNLQGGTGLIMTLRDFSLLADFLLSDGMGIVDAAYLREATSWQIATDERSGPEERYGYGYQIWMMRRGFSMYGLAGQMAMCLPDEGLTLCTTANLMMDAPGVQPLYDAFFRHLSGIGTLPHSEQDAAELNRRIAALAFKPLSGASAAKDISIMLNSAALPFTRLLIMEKGIVLGSDSGSMEISAGNGTWAQGSFLGVPCMSSFRWQTPDRYHLHIELLGDWCSNVDLYAALRGDRAVVRVVSSIWELAKGWSGQDSGTVTIG